MKIVLSTVLEYDNLVDVAAACADCIETNNLNPEEYDGVPEYWDDPETWDEDTVKDFLKYNGKLFVNDVVDPDDLFKETRVEIED